MRFDKTILLGSIYLLSACQVFAGTSQLTESNIMSDAGPGPDTSRDAAPAEAGRGGGGGKGGAGDEPEPVAGSGGASGEPAVGGEGGGGSGGMKPEEPACEKPEGAACDLYEECGCDEETEHCQARGAEAKATCVKRGEKKIGEPCKSPDDCAEGTCDQRVCRAYCEESDDCNAGQCLPATGEGDKPLKDIKVCWRACQAGNSDSCTDGTTCQTREVDGKKASFCIPPADPCPTVEDGHCDEPVMCAPGTDSVDCSCEKADDVECNHVAQCGCRMGKSCKLSEADFKPICGEIDGAAGPDELCSSNESCGAGLACTTYDYGSCHKYCADKTDCKGEDDKCVQVTSNGEDVPGFKVCVSGCSDSNPCPPNNSCVQQEPGVFLCHPFKPEIAGGTCNLSKQRGCEATPGTACMPTATGTVCEPHNGQRPRGASCAASSECEAGNVCVAGVCRHFCDDTAPGSSDVALGCVPGGLCTAPRLSTGSDAPFKICLEPCTADSDCDTGSLCRVGEVGRRVGYCAAPMTPCPTDNICDEPIPRGTGSCVAGSDTADCGGAP